MRIFLFLLAVLTFLIALLHLMVAKSAIHEIAAYVLYLTSAVLLSGAGIIEAITRLQRTVAPAGAPDASSDRHRYPPG